MYCRKWYTVIDFFVLLGLVLLCLDCCDVLSLPILAWDDGENSLCNREVVQTERRRSPGDQGFRIVVVGHEKRYKPHHVYTVVINGTFLNQKFQGFMLVAVPVNAVDETTTMGTFQEIDQTQTRFADECPHIVTHADLRPKSKIEVLWIAPPPGVGCLEFRALVIANNEFWLKDDGALKQIFCEE